MNTTCDSCIHNEVCRLNPENGCGHYSSYATWIHLPCPIGTTVYRVCCKKYDVDGYGMNWYEDWGIITNSFDCRMLREIGKTVFLTREEAEQALAIKEKDSGSKI